MSGRVPPSCFDSICQCEIFLNLATHSKCLFFEREEGENPAFLANGNSASWTYIFRPIQTKHKKKRYVLATLLFFAMRIKTTVKFTDAQVMSSLSVIQNPTLSRTING